MRALLVALALAGVAHADSIQARTHFAAEADGVTHVDANINIGTGSGAPTNAAADATEGRTAAPPPVDASTVYNSSAWISTKASAGNRCAD